MPTYVVPSRERTSPVLKPKTTLEVIDLDEFSTEEEVNVAVKIVIGAPTEIKTFVS